MAARAGDPRAYAAYQHRAASKPGISDAPLLQQYFSEDFCPVAATPYRAW